MNKEMNEQTDILLVKYMLGEATREEQQQVHQWLNEDAANQQYYQQLETIWQQSKQLEAKSNMNGEDAWKRFQQKKADGCFEAAAPVRSLPVKQSRRRLYIAAAAAIAILAAGSWLLLLNNWPGSNTEQLMANNSVLSDTLPDGSIVTLNKNARIRYAKTFLNNTTREVQLEGEAFFDIAPDRNKPFIINTGDVSIRVTGTSFNVKSSSKATEVIVETGSVQVTYNRQTVQLVKKEKATVTKNNKQLKKQQDSSELHNYYRTGKFICENTPLHQLVSVLNEAYGSDITIGNSAIANLPLTTTFNQESLDTVLSVISKTFNIQVLKQNNQIILK